MIKGCDVSNLLQIEKNGGRYYEDGIKKDALTILKDNGINLFRLRLFNDPYDELGNSYGAGECDINCVKKLATRAKQLGVDWLLDFHYSDCWADPGKQTMPKAWVGLSLDELTEQLYQFTKQTLQVLKEENISPEIIAVGNEITNGLLWPVGKAPNWQAICQLVSAGIKACKEVLPQAKTMIHLDNGGNSEMYANWFGEYFKNGGADFDVIGLSYYPFWHGSFDDLRRTLSMLSNTYGKEMVIAETSYGFTMEDYKEYEGLSDWQRKGMAIKPELLEGLQYPLTKQGQCQFMLHLASVVDEFDKCTGFIYWGGESIPVPNSGWATEAGIEYMHEKGPGGNEWANQALFDYQGNSLPVLQTIKIM